MFENDPANIKQVMKSSNSQKWIDVMNEEIKSMYDNDVWIMFHCLKIKNC
jgi:hypothetical protein